MLMFIDVDGPRARIDEKGLKMQAVADCLEIDRSTLYRWFRNGGKSFRVKDAMRLSELLDLSAGERDSIFFTLRVARNANSDEGIL